MTHPILTVEEIRAAEHAADAAGVSLQELMRRAGGACADYVQDQFPRGRVVVICGPGNNGGDGFVAATRLARRGREVMVFEMAREGASGERGWARKEWPGACHKFEDVRLRNGDVVVDAMFGAGLSRPLDGEPLRVARLMAETRAPVVAIDVPSGVSGDSGRVAGEAVRANATVTFGALKPAHVLQPAAGWCGAVVVMPIGFEQHLEGASPNPPQCNGPALWQNKIRWPDEAVHKHDRGRLVVVSGGAANSGAARLAAQAGLRVGAGLVTLACPDEALSVVAASVTAVMCAPFGSVAELLRASERASAVVIGPAAGVTDSTRAKVEALAKAGRRLVLDADALSVFANDAAALMALSADAVLTPHAGEFERLFPGLLDEASSKIEAARRAAAASGCVVLLKGADTVIATPDGRAVVNTHATPFLATAGSGDVLAGVVGGLLAQGMETFDAACAGAWMHGDAGLVCGVGMTAEDLDMGLRTTLTVLHAERGSVVRR